eukprot:Skav218367  [mRNA]  locus=scaffold2066:152858:154482:+ [translate_table: standard]
MSHFFCLQIFILEETALGHYLDRDAEERNRRAQPSGPKAKAAPGWQTAGSGRSLGGQVMESEKPRHVTAAERRQNQVAGVSEKKDLMFVVFCYNLQVQEMRQKEQKDALLGKLASSSVEQLKQHWETVRKDRATQNAVLQS